MKIILLDGAVHNIKYGGHIPSDWKIAAFELYYADLMASGNHANMMLFLSREIFVKMQPPSIVTPSHIPTFSQIYGDSYDHKLPWKPK